MIAIIDYDAGNIKSVEKALSALSAEAVVTREAEVILQADKVILPGVGSFGDAMDKLHRYGLVSVIKKTIENGTPFLGICLGLQLLFESSEESQGIEGLGILKGRILRILCIFRIRAGCFAVSLRNRMSILYIPIICRQRMRGL